MAKQKYFIGGEYDTPQGRIKILDLIPKNSRLPGRSNKRAVILFVKSGWVANVQMSNIPLGKIKDKRKPTVYGVGYIDTNLIIPPRKSGAYIRQVYDLWANMLKRCYGKTSDQTQKWYGDVTVDKRWHSFRHFLGTVYLIRGYDKWVKDSSMHLDKDLANSRTYNLKSCIFITGSENATISNNKRWHGVNALVLR